MPSKSPSYTKHRSRSRSRSRSHSPKLFSATHIQLLPHIITPNHRRGVKIPVITNNDTLTVVQATGPHSAKKNNANTRRKQRRAAKAAKAVPPAPPSSPTRS
jgi:hypothetical protein